MSLITQITTAGTKERVLSSFVEKEIKAYVVSRADRLVWSESKFMARVLDFWLQAGAPAIHDLELALPPMPPPAHLVEAASSRSAHPWPRPAS